MSKDSRKCPDCEGPDFGALFGGKGNGLCSHCKGEGKVYGIEDAIAGLAGFDNFHTCEICSGTGQCQTCGGTGYQYYNDGDYDENSSEDEEYESSNSSYSSSGSSYSSGDSSYSSYPTSYKSNSSCSSDMWGCLGIVAVVALIVIIINVFSDSGSNKRNSIPTQEIPVTTNINSTDNTNNNPRKNLLDGRWVKIDGISYLGIVVSFENNNGTIISVPDSAYKFNLGRIEWTNYEPENNRLQFLVHLADGYLWTGVKFKGSDTLKLLECGETYVRLK